MRERLKKESGIGKRGRLPRETQEKKEDLGGRAEKGPKQRRLLREGAQEPNSPLDGAELARGRSREKERAERKVGILMLERGAEAAAFPRVSGSSQCLARRSLHYGYVAASKRAKLMRQQQHRKSKRRRLMLDGSDRLLVWEPCIPVVYHSENDYDKDQEDSR